MACVVAVALVQGVGALLLACWIWRDSSPQRIEACRQVRLRRLSGGIGQQGAPAEAGFGDSTAGLESGGV